MEFGEHRLIMKNLMEIFMQKIYYGNSIKSSAQLRNIFLSISRQLCYISYVTRLINV